MYKQHSSEKFGKYFLFLATLHENTTLQECLGGISILATLHITTLYNLKRVFYFRNVAKTQFVRNIWNVLPILVILHKQQSLRRKVWNACQVVWHSIMERIWHHHTKAKDLVHGHTAVNIIVILQKRYYNLIDLKNYWRMNISTLIKELLIEQHVCWKSKWESLNTKRRVITWQVILSNYGIYNVLRRYRWKPK